MVAQEIVGGIRLTQSVRIRPPSGGRSASRKTAKQLATMALAMELKIGCMGLWGIGCQRSTARRHAPTPKVSVNSGISG